MPYNRCVECEKLLPVDELWDHECAYCKKKLDRESDSYEAEIRADAEEDERE